MEHDLVATALGVASDFGGTWMIGKDGERQGITQREDGVYSGGIRRNIVQNDSEARAGRGGVRKVTGNGGFGRTIGLEERLNRGLYFAATGEGNRKRCQGQAEEYSGDSPGGRKPKIHERD
jgi:hypothetical protein